MNPMNSVKKCLLNVMTEQIIIKRSISMQKLETSLIRKSSVAYKSRGTIGDKDSCGNYKGTFLYVPGLSIASNLNGQKADCLLRYCVQNDHPFVAYDHECLGESEGDKKNLQFSHWIEGLQTVIDKLTEGPVTIVANGIGAWLSLIVAKQMSIKRLHGMVLFSPAINNLWIQYNNQFKRVNADVAHSLGDGDTFHGGLFLKKVMAAESRAFHLDLNVSSQFDFSGIPIKIVHGLNNSEMKTEDVILLSNALKSANVDLLFRKDGNHEMEKFEDHVLFINIVDRLMKDYPPPAKYYGGGCS